MILVLSAMFMAAAYQSEYEGEPVAFGARLVLALFGSLLLGLALHEQDMIERKNNGGKNKPKN